MKIFPFFTQGKCFISIGLTKELQSLTASNKGDSEDQMTPDTDDSGAHSYPGEGFKRAQQSKACTYPPKETPKPHKACNLHFTSLYALIKTPPLSFIV